MIAGPDAIVAVGAPSRGCRLIRPLASSGRGVGVANWISVMFRFAPAHWAQASVRSDSDLLIKVGRDAVRGPASPVRSAARPGIPQSTGQPWRLDRSPWPANERIYRLFFSTNSKTTVPSYGSICRDRFLPERGRAIPNTKQPTRQKMVSAKLNGLQLSPKVRLPDGCAAPSRRHLKTSLCFPRV